MPHSPHRVTNEFGYSARTQKLKSKGAICRSTKHAFREQDTPNADPKLTPENTHIGARSSDEAMAAVNARLPDKIRKNGVMAIEYLITASPEAMTAKSRKDEDNHFHDSLASLKQNTGLKRGVCGDSSGLKNTAHVRLCSSPLTQRKIKRTALFRRR